MIAVINRKYYQRPVVIIDVMCKHQYFNALAWDGENILGCPTGQHCVFLARERFGFGIWSCSSPVILYSLWGFSGFLRFLFMKVTGYPFKGTARFFTYHEVNKSCHSSHQRCQI